MSIQAITTKAISTLGNKDSLIPVMLKDGVDSASLTYKSFKEGGTVEGIDRAIDEFGTEAIWIGGIPFFKKLFEVTAYKKAKINPGVDPRIIADKEYSIWAKENAKGVMSNSKTQTVKEAFTEALKDGGEKAKKLYKGKVITATALTFGTFFMLTKLKQKNTKNIVINDMQNKNSDSFECSQDRDSIFSEFEMNKTKEKNTPSFKGLLKNVSEAVMFNPVHNMQIIDAGITTERLACSRNKTEFCEHAIKEGGFLFFLYGFGGLVEKGINAFSSKFLNKPIDLNINVLMDSKLADALSQGKIPADLKQAAKNKTLTEKLNFIVQNPDNILVQSAKKSDIISTVKDKSGCNFVDTSKYIDMKAFDELAVNLGKINDKYQSNKEPLNKYLSKTKALKAGSVIANIGISCLFLGYLIPKAVYKYREIKTGTTKFHVEEDIKNNKVKNGD